MRTTSAARIPPPLKAPQEIERLAVRKMQVDQREIETKVAQGAARLIDGRRLRDLRAERAEMGRKSALQRRVVLKQKHLAASREGSFVSNHDSNASKARASFNAIRRVFRADPAAGNPRRRDAPRMLPTPNQVLGTPLRVLQSTIPAPCALLKNRLYDHK